MKLASSSSSPYTSFYLALAFMGSKHCDELMFCLNALHSPGILVFSLLIYMKLPRYLLRSKKKKSLSLLRLFTGLLCHVYNGSSFLLLREIHLCSTKLF